MYYRYSRQEIAIGREEGKLHKFFNIIKTKAVFETIIFHISRKLVRVEPIEN